MSATVLLACSRSPHANLRWMRSCHCRSDEPPSRASSSAERGTARGAALSQPRSRRGSPSYVARVLEHMAGRRSIRGSAPFLMAVSASAIVAA